MLSPTKGRLQVDAIQLSSLHVAQLLARHRLQAISRQHCLLLLSLEGCLKCIYRRNQEHFVIVCMCIFEFTVLLVYYYRVCSLYNYIMHFIILLIV